MFKVVSGDGKVLGFANDVVYIKKSTNGCYVPCSSEDAEGIAFKSTPYSLNNEESLEGAVGTVSLSKFDSLDELFNNSNAVADIENALCELSELGEGE